MVGGNPPGRVAAQHAGSESRKSMFGYLDGIR
jgi:hypothetical protein